MVERQDCAGFLAWSQCVNSLCQVAKVVRPTHLMSHLFARPSVMARPPFWEPSSLSLIGSSDNSTTWLLTFLGPRPSRDEISWMRTSCHAASFRTIFQLKYLTPDLGWNLSWHHTSHSFAFFLPKNTLLCSHFLFLLPGFLFITYPVTR